jgi:hypothetical protein
VSSGVSKFMAECSLLDHTPQPFIREECRAFVVFITPSLENEGIYRRIGMGYIWDQDVLDKSTLQSIEII